jgi:hypothetical protein
MQKDCLIDTDELTRHMQVINKAAVRLYYYHRWVGTVQPAMQKDCLIDTDELTSTCR